MTKKPELLHIDTELDTAWFGVSVTSSKEKYRIIEERGYFVKSDMDNLRDIFDDLEEEERYDNSAGKRNA